MGLLCCNEVIVFGLNVSHRLVRQELIPVAAMYFGLSSRRVEVHFSQQQLHMLLLKRWWILEELFNLLVTFPSTVIDISSCDFIWKCSHLWPRQFSTLFFSYFCDWQTESFTQESTLISWEQTLLSFVLWGSRQAWGLISTTPDG